MISETSLHYFFCLDNLDLFSGRECKLYPNANVPVSSRLEEAQQSCSRCHCPPSLQGGQPFSFPCPRCPSRPQSAWWGRWTSCRGESSLVKTHNMHDSTAVVLCLPFQIKVLLTFKFGIQPDIKNMQLFRIFSFLCQQDSQELLPTKW